MGISDDIKPKKATEKMPDPAAVEIVEEPEETPSQKPEGQVEIPIDKSGHNKPVLDDISDSSEEEQEDVDESFSQIKSRAHKALPAKDEIHEKQTSEDLLEDEPPVDRKDSFKSFAEYHREQPRKSHLLTVIIVLFVVLLAVLLVLQNYDQIKKLFGKGSSSGSTSQTQSNPSVEVISNQDKDSDTTPATTATTSTSNSSTETTASSSTATTTPTATSTATPAAAVRAPSTLKMKVLNGNGITGSAASVKDTLVAAGYVIPGVSNASKFTYTVTEIYYNTGLKAEADAVATVLSSRKTEVVENATVTGSYDIVVVVGKS